MSSITLQKSKAPVVEGEFDEADEPDHLLSDSERPVFSDQTAWERASQALTFPQGQMK